jgi:hypothetical protein
MLRTLAVTFIGDLRRLPRPDAGRQLARQPPSRRHILPKDLPGAIKHLDDQELDRLLAAVLAEQKRRGTKPAVPTETTDKPRIEAVAVLSQSDVRKALASDASR